MEIKKFLNDEGFIDEELREEFDTKFISLIALVYFALMIFTLFLYNQN